jgi:pyruvate/2-oxoglutarate dehydrogenase complex dihydrolipoamide dehydrogenase (E3) component
MSDRAENVHDVIVIGAGPIGYTVADRARAAGLSVAAVERSSTRTTATCSVSPSSAPAWRS